MPTTLLIVDDSQLIRDRLVCLFDHMRGITAIDDASSLAQAAEKLAHAKPTLMILDLHLADGDAIPMIPTLMRLAPAMRIAMLTNDANPFTRSQCLRAGAEWFFDKSTEIGNLLEMVQMQADLNQPIPI